LSRLSHRHFLFALADGACHLVELQTLVALSIIRGAKEQHICAKVQLIWFIEKFVQNKRDIT